MQLRSRSYGEFRSFAILFALLSAAALPGSLKA